MKKILFIGLLFFALSAKAQITISSNPALVTPATTTTQKITISKTFSTDPRGTIFPTPVWIKLSNSADTYELSWL